MTFRYQDNKGPWHRTLAAEKFISRFLQHVLPKGFVKVRYHGFLSSRELHLLDVIQELFAWAKKKLDHDSSSSGATEVG